MKKLIKVLLLLIFMISCLQDDDYTIPKITCIPSTLTSTKSIQEIFDSSTKEAQLYSAEDVIEAYVISDDQKGNFYKILYLQNLEGSIGLSIPIDNEHLYTMYNPGRKVYINLKNLHVQIKNDGLIIGNLIDNEIHRLARSNYKNIVIPACDKIDTSDLLKSLSLSELNDSHINTLVSLNDVQFEEVAVGRSFYDAFNDSGGGTNYKLIDISGTQIRLRTQSFADFGQAIVPSGNGTIKGVLTKFGPNYQLLPSSIDDFNLDDDRKRIGFAESITGTSISIQDIRSFYDGKDIKYTEDKYIEGIVTMSGIGQNNLSDRTVFIQDETAGIALRFSKVTSLIKGQKVRVNLKDAVLNGNRGLLQVNLVQWEDVLFLADNVSFPTPIPVQIETLNNGFYQGQLIALNNVQFEIPEGTLKGSQVITDCREKIKLVTLNTANFAKKKYPSKLGNLIAIGSSVDEPALIIRDTLDLADMSFERCIPKGDLTDALFFSELADPENDVKARFIELYNASDKNIDLTGWEIHRFTNANNVSTAKIDLTGSSINPGQAFVIAVNGEAFQSVYGLVPDLIGAANGPAGSNGDDNIQLIDPDGLIIDTFGIPGEDGSGTNHEFEDGRAVRKVGIVIGSSIFKFNEWQVYNDTGAQGTINLPQKAPENFTPGKR